ncbi:MAG: DNA polymerase III subunit chi [Candidatus Neptunochlamydia sp.]|nr:DNA polymerase III subunit chi [Candidatus Neptunochlamydia sp.]
MNRNVRIIFFQVKSDAEKRERIIGLAEEYFEKKEPLVIQLPHQKALEYVDLLLWRAPKESFLPHTIKDEPTQGFIVLTSSGKNPNSARSVLNLCPEPVDNKSLSFLKIYELEDLASTHKNRSAQERYKAYKNAGHGIITI